MARYHPLRDFITATWRDWLILSIMGAITGGVWTLPHLLNRYLPVMTPGEQVYWPELAYPYLTPNFSPAMAGVLAAAIPIIVFAIVQLWYHSFVDLASACLGLAYSLVTGTCFQVILKKTIGGFRPHFLDVCEPELPPSIFGYGYLHIMYKPEQICTGDPGRIQNALESFPSGHAQIAFAGFGYLAIYFFTHLRLNSRDRPGYWRMLAIVAPLLIATYVTCTLVLGYHHHGHDVIFGALIGCIMAVFGYRMVFKVVLDSKLNDVPYLE